MSRLLRIAVVGCGDIARFTSIGFAFNKGIKTAACADKNISRARSFTRWFRIPEYFEDYYEMLEKCSLDAVYLAVPHVLHKPMIMAAIEKGLNVFCEKPVTTSMDDALEVCAAAHESGLKVGINYQYRYDSACYRMAQASRAGELGEIYCGRCSIPWKRTSKYFSNAPWHSSLEASGGGTLLTQGSHALDILLWACGKTPLRVAGMTGRKRFMDSEVEDLAMAQIELEGGIMLQALSTMVASQEQKVAIDIYGGKGTALYRGFSSPKVRFLGINPQRHVPPAKGIHALFKSIEGFRAWVAEGIQYLIPVQQSLKVLSVIEAVYRSAANGRIEKVDTRFEDYCE